MVGRVVVVFLILACAGLVLSNYYAGLVGAVMSPVVLFAFWAIRPDADRNLRPLALARPMKSRPWPLC